MTASNSNATNAAITDTPVFPLDVPPLTDQSRPMQSTRTPVGIFRRLLAAGALTAMAAVTAHGQASLLKQVTETPAPAKTADAEKPVDARERLEQLLRDARDTLARQDANTAAASLPEGITTEEMQDRHRDLQQLVLTATRALKNLDAAADARKTLESSRNENDAWTGFKDKPPYSLLMIDELLNERDAIQAKLTSHEAALANYDSILATTLKESKAAEETISERVVAVRNASEATTPAAKWRLEAARCKARPLAIRSDLLQNLCDSLKDLIAAAKIDLSLIDRKVKLAKTKCRFNDQDMAQIAKLSDARKLSIQKELELVAKRLKAAQTARAQAQSAVDALTPAVPPLPATPTPNEKGNSAQTGKEAAATKEAESLELAKFRLEVAENRVDSLESIIERLEGLTQLENMSLDGYKIRRSIIDATSNYATNKAVDELAILLDRIRAWGNVIDNEIAASSADLSKLESLAATVTAEDPRYSLLNDQRAAFSEKLAMLQRIAQGVMAERNLLRRWFKEYSPDSENAGWWTRLAKFGHASWATIKDIWSFEVMSFEDKVATEDGRTHTYKIPVTLGLLLRALLFFLIGYRIASHIAKRIQRTLVRRNRLGEAQARTLRNWAMIVVGCFLAIGTLAFLHIPLTVFAFFGGALAIGLGFGTQTLIKNFVSGIILLTERKVRVGDTVDVEGVVGVITEINTRSSVVRSPGDIETMIPNSVFLDNRVTNWTLTHAKIRRNLRVGVAYGTPPQAVMEILLECAGRHGLVCKTPAPFAVFEEFGDNAIIFQLYFWLELVGTTTTTTIMIVTSDLRLMIEKRFAESAIAVPFPQRDMRLSSTSPIQVQVTAAETNK